MAMLWVLNFSDGKHSLLDIAERSKLPFSVIERAAAQLETAGLLRHFDTSSENIHINSRE
jgi:aminopeptidase-like protein